MKRRDPARMAGVPGLEQVERFSPAHLADNDPVGAQAQGRADKVLQAGAAAMGSELNHIGRSAAWSGTCYRVDWRWWFQHGAR